MRHKVKITAQVEAPCNGAENNGGAPIGEGAWSFPEDVRVGAVTLTTDGRYVLVGASDGCIRAWDTGGLDGAPAFELAANCSRYAA